MNEKLQKYEKDIDVLKAPQMKLTDADAANKLMELLEGGRWNFASYLSPNEAVIWSLFQDVGQDLAKN